MKKLNLFTVIIVIAITSMIVACGAQREEKDLKILYSLTKGEPELDKLLKEYVEMISVPDDISSEEEILEIFQLRDSLILKLYPTIDEYYWILVEDDKYNEFENLEKELMEIGISTVYAEGMVVGLVSSPILEKQIDEYGSEPFKLYCKFMDAYSNSQGGEYPFIDLSAQMEMVDFGEKLYQNYPDSKYIEMIEFNFNFAVQLLTDFHKVTDLGQDYTQYLTEGMSVDYWPYGTSLENFTTFVQDYPNVKLTKVVKEILKNTSEIYVDFEKEGSDPIYLIAIEELDDYLDAQNKVLDYILNGIDIPHIVILERGSDYSYAIVYRFYSDKNLADRMFNSIKLKYPDAYMLKVNMYGQII
ncbi:MAG: hypothetical protein JW866_01605 [Ignavibacteriales bacterium]|nr:hypothetical protein [Ignavibacteriales bacterium]